MRSKMNLPGSANRRVAGDLGAAQMPVEWLDAGNWRLPSGKALAEFALQAGFLAPMLFKADPLHANSDERTDESAAGAHAKDFSKGSDE